MSFERERESLENFGCVRVKEIKRDSSVWWGTLRGYIGSLALVLRWGKPRQKPLQVTILPLSHPSLSYLSFHSFMYLFNYPFLVSF